ncbi:MULTISPECIES: molybdopterin oxidoreductase family protein [Synechococcaceae]|uniref:molybdopterin oxidoreductase family protein n=1 Tax=Synechococcaceae TaxID=1890426 RepID=UPI000B340AFE|nr:MULTISPECIES: nitrate reductase [Synechococcaceae]MCT4365023.1 nitrate reductase [Candidatus Regnicoccus frigidus MAG-AL1]MCT4367818.1 nitrate reductase [Candidatus Regnicoccus frigidus MAG-AL2]TWB90686.1 ferredoxin-nitrate reductase [Synechococcus sp. Ace-Pa]
MVAEMGDSPATTEASAVNTQCPYCGVGCGLTMLPPAAPNQATRRGVDGLPIWGVKGDRGHPSSLGQVCIKGATVGETLDRSRLLEPLYRPTLDQPFQPISWEKALDLIAGQIQNSLARQRSDSIALYGSGQFHTEDYYVAQKLIKGAIGSNNFDANSRLCMSSAVAGYARSLGSDGPPCCYDDLDHCDLAFLIGTNTAACHPVLFQRLVKRRKKNPRQLKIVVVDPRATATSDAADLHLAIQPGTDLALLYGLAHLLLARRTIDHEFIDEATDGFPAFAAVLKEWTPTKVAAICGVSEDKLRRVAELWGGAGAALSLWSMGVNQSVEGTATVAGLINLHLLTGQIGRPGAGPFSLTGQPNAMGGREAGGLAHLLPGYRNVNDAGHRDEVERAWDLAPGSIAPRPGLAAWQQLEAMERGEIDLWWVAATNPLVSMPNLERVKAAMALCPLIVLSEAYAGTETAHYAHLLLPAAQWSEKQGTMTNSERRVTFCPAFRRPPGKARPDWEIFAAVGRRLGFEHQFTYTSAAEVYAEHAQLSAGRLCDVSGLSHELLASHGPQQWPAPKGSAPTTEAKRLYTDLLFPTANGRARFCADLPLGLGEPISEGYPLVLTVGRYLGQWHTMTRTAQVPRLVAMHPEPLLEMHPVDALDLGLADGALARITSRRSSITARLSISDRIRAGTVFLPMHWGFRQELACEANALMHELACPISGQPELKAAAVRVEAAAAVILPIERRA